MTSDEEPDIEPDETALGDEEEERQSTPFLVLQFFIFPMAIVAVCVTVFVIFGLIASETKDADAYLQDVRSGSTNRRWQAAFELSKLLQGGEDPILEDPQFIARVLALFEDAKDDDPRVRRYLAVTLGRLKSSDAVEPLAEAAAQEGDDQTRIFAIWSLGAIGDARAVPALSKLARDTDAGLRKAAIHALGAIDDPGAASVLGEALGDGSEDVRWNAALALARRRDPAVVPTLLAMLDRGHLGTLPEIQPNQIEQALLLATEAAAFLSGDPELRSVLEQLKASDSNLKVREAARRALETVPTGESLTR